MNENEEYITLVEKAAKARGEKSVPREYIIKALERIKNRQDNVTKYPNGIPTLKGVSEIAVRLFKTEKRN